jgi:hypothetical protein
VLQGIFLATRLLLVKWKRAAQKENLNEDLGTRFSLRASSVAEEPGADSSRNPDADEVKTGRAIWLDKIIDARSLLPRSEPVRVH